MSHERTAVGDARALHERSLTRAPMRRANKARAAHRARDGHRRSRMIHGTLMTRICDLRELTSTPVGVSGVDGDSCVHTSGRR